MAKKSTKSPTTPRATTAPLRSRANDGGRTAMPRKNKQQGADTPAGRLIAARRRAGFETQSDAAERFGWSVSSVSQHECGARGIKHAVEKYARAYGVPADWLRYGHGHGQMTDATQPEKRASTHAPAGDRTPLGDTPVVPHVQAGVPGLAGKPVYVHEHAAATDDVPRTFAISPEFLAGDGTPPDLSSLAALRVGPGRPELNGFISGDWVLVDTSARHVPRSGVYALHSADDGPGFLLRRLNTMVGQRPPSVIVTTDNPTYSHDAVVSQLAVIGRVVGVIKTL